MAQSGANFTLNVLSLFHYSFFLQKCLLQLVKSVQHACTVGDLISLLLLMLACLMLLAFFTVFFFFFFMRKIEESMGRLPHLKDNK